MSRFGTESRVFAGQTLTPLAEIHEVHKAAGSEESGLFWFFSPDNWEVLVKVLDGCALNNHFWVFAAATTSVEYTLTVVDTLTGEEKSYASPLGTRGSAITDTAALATCSAVTSSVFCTESETELCLTERRFAVRVDWRDFAGETGVGRVVPLAILPSTLVITATPASINIEQASTISVIARDGRGLPLAGERVRLRTSLGFLADERLTTDAYGEATAVLRASSDGRTGLATITGILSSNDPVTVPVHILGTQILVTVSPSVLDTTELATVTLQVQDEDSVPLIAAGRYFVELTASLGLFDSDTVEIVSGRGEATYTAGSTAGQDTINATLANAQPGSATVDLRSIPTSLVLSVNTNTVSPTGGSVTLTARVSDANGLALPSEFVTFTLEDEVGGVFTPSRSVGTDINGEAEITVTFSSTDLTSVSADGEVTITASTRGPYGQPPVADTVTIRVE